TSPWHSRRARDGIKKLPTFSQSLNDSGLSRARWSGNNKEDSVTCESHQIVILSEAKKLRLLLSRDSRSKSQRCFASLNMTRQRALQQMEVGCAARFGSIWAKGSPYSRF